MLRPADKPRGSDVIRVIRYIFCAYMHELRAQITRTNHALNYAPKPLTTAMTIRIA